MISFEKELILAKELAVEAGEIADQYFSHSVERELKHDGSPVTEADIAINSLIIKRVGQIFPGHKIIGEEECGGDENSSIAWIVDPIDGTRSFAEGIPVGTVLIAITADGEPQASVTYEHREKRMYFAHKGEGAWLQNVGDGRAEAYQLHTSSKKSLVRSFGNIAGYNSFSPRTVGYNIHEGVTLKGEGARVLDLNATGYHAAMVAKGSWEFAVVGLTTAHDIAAAALLVPEAGGRVTDLQGNNQRYDQPINGAIVSNGHVHDELLEIVADAYSRD
mgnify:CR=1 FL=1